MAAADSSPGEIDAVRAAVAGQYSVDRLLGQGGMGAVYLGRDVTLDRPVAIKVIKPDVAANDLIRDRFLQEARSVARLRHPNIVSVYAAGESNDLLYFAMELVQGESLRELMEKEGRLPHSQAERIIGEIALALDHAHSHGLVHRDVKPDNILIESATGRALLTDFGVARAEQAGAERGLTQTGMIIGSPRYMSPEQISGDGNIDGRADLYALALVGYELYTGAPVVANGTVASMIYKHMSETPPPLATAVPGIPPHVSAAIARGLEKDPAQRWQTGADFARAIRGEAPGARAAASHGRRRRLGFVAAVVAAAVVIGVWFGMSGSSAKGNAFLVTPFEIQSGDPGIAWLREGSVNMLTLTLGQWSDLNVVDYERTLSLIDAAELGAKTRLSAEDAFALARRAQASRVVMGQVLTTGDSLIVIAKLYDVASEKSDQQAQASAARGSDPRPLFDRLGQQLLNVQGFNGASTVQLAAATTSNLAAYRTYLDGVKLLNSWRLAEADSAFARSIALDTTFALAYHKRALGLGWSQSGGPEYLAISDRAYALSSRLPPRERSLVAGHHHLVLALTHGITDSLGAAREFEQSIKAYRDLIEPPRGDSLVAEAWYGLADAYFHARIPNATLDQVAQQLTRSLRSFRKTLAIDSTYHLAYSHLVQLYNNASTGNGPLIIGDSAVFADSATVARLGVARVQALRAEAQRQGIEISRAWAHADDGSTQGYYQLAQSYASAGMVDSGVTVLREGLARPRAGSALARMALLLFEEAADDTGAITTFDYILDRFTPDTLREMSTSTRFTLEGSLMSSAALRGNSADVARAAKLYRETDPTLPFVNVSSASMIDYFQAAHQLALGDSMTPALRRRLTDTTWMDSVPPQLRYAARTGSVSIPYLAFLVTHDTLFAAQVRGWSGAARNASDIEAILALDRGDTARALTIARGFPSIDTLRTGRFSLAGMRTIARAEVLERLGLDRLAAETYEAMSADRLTRGGLVDPGLAVWVRSFVAQGRLWAKLGERDKAIAAYEEFVRRWKDADGAAARQVEQVRGELARLKDTRPAR
jgi:serine/threonine-protein kinase